MAGLTDMIEAVRVLEEREDSESTCSWDDDEMSVDGNEASGSDRAPELYSESEVARIKLRFAVGDTVSCTIDKGRADGIVVQRFYREDEWPRGHYAAVRTASEAASPQALSFRMTCSAFACPFWLMCFCSTKCGCYTPMIMIPMASVLSTHLATKIATSSERRRFPHQRQLSMWTGV